MQLINVLILICFFETSFGDLRVSHCEKISTESNYYDYNTIVETSVKTLKGVWLSEGCETRPGPEYILRHYKFDVDGKFKLIQHHYWDRSCSSPKFSITAFGNLKTRKDIFLNKKALCGYPKLINISIIPQDSNAINYLENLMSSNCPDKSWKPWKIYEEYLVYSNTLNHKVPFYNHNRHNRQLKPIHIISNNFMCLGNLQWTFNEIKLLQVQLKPNFLSSSNKTHEMHWELLLGDIPSHLSLFQHYIPTAFQVPLVKVSQGETVTLKGFEYYVKYSCNICLKLTSNEQIPPHLIEKPKLPPYIWGEWISEQCEIRPLGLYLKRKFTFLKKNLIWIGEHKFYTDSSCRFPKFFVTPSGTFSQEKVNKYMQDTTNMNFKISKATLTVFDQAMINSLSRGTRGKSHWKVGVPQELEFTNGCFQLGIQIPSTYLDIIKTEVSYHGLWLLYMGLPDTENMSRMLSERPTAFQLPLTKCDYTSDEISSEINNKGNFININHIHHICILIFTIILNL